MEVKIWNRNQHFGQYEEAFGIPSERLGYIVNYALHVEGYTVHTWEVFYKYLADKAPADERDVWAGYRAYVKTTCWIFDRTTPIRPHDEDFEDAFTQLIARAISRVSDEKVECELYGNRSRNLITGDNIGREFHFRRTDGTVGDTRGSFVVYDYDKDMPAVYIAFKSHDQLGRTIHPPLRHGRKSRHTQPRPRQCVLGGRCALGGARPSRVLRLPHD